MKVQLWRRLERVSASMPNQRKPVIVFRYHHESDEDFQKKIAEYKDQKIMIVEFVAPDKQDL